MPFPIANSFLRNAPAKGFKWYNPTGNQNWIFPETNPSTPITSFDSPRPLPQKNPSFTPVQSKNPVTRTTREIVDDWMRSNVPAKNPVPSMDKYKEILQLREAYQESLKNGLLEQLSPQESFLQAQKNRMQKAGLPTDEIDSLIQAARQEKLRNVEDLFRKTADTSLPPSTSKPPTGHGIGGLKVPSAATKQVKNGIKKIVPKIAPKLLKSFGLSLLRGVGVGSDLIMLGGALDKLARQVQHLGWHLYDPTASMQIPRAGGSWQDGIESINEALSQSLSSPESVAAFQIQKRIGDIQIQAILSAREAFPERYPDDILSVSPPSWESGETKSSAYGTFSFGFHFNASTYSIHINSGTWAFGAGYRTLVYSWPRKYKGARLYGSAWRISLEWGIDTLKDYLDEIPELIKYYTRSDGTYQSDIVTPELVFYPTNISPPIPSLSTDPRINGYNGHREQQKKKKRKKDMNCCNVTADNNRLLRMIAQWTGANNQAILVPGNPFIDDNQMTDAMPSGMDALFQQKTIRSLPEFMWYHMDCLDALYGEFPFELDVPDEIVEAASKSGETIPTKIKIYNIQDAFEEVLKLSFNLQDDEATTKGLMMRSILEAHLARQEATRARKNIESLIKWTGMKIKEKMIKLKANFTIPGVTNFLSGLGFNGIGIDAWESENDTGDKQLKKFLETSDMPVKYWDIDKESHDLKEDLLILREIASIIKHTHTVALDYRNIEDAIDGYIKDFGDKSTKATTLAKDAVRKRGTPVKGDDTSNDKERLTSLKKWLKHAEEGYQSPQEDGSDSIDVEDNSSKYPFGRTYNERPEIKEINPGNGSKQEP